MKTTKIISALSLVLVFAASSLFANRISDPGPAVWQKPVTYDVKINFTANFPGINGHYLVVITDETGRKVVPAQTFRPGVWTYTFKEAGSFRGTRVAVLVSYPDTQILWVIPPRVLKGTFTGGESYRFELTPQAIEKVGPGIR